MRKKAPSQGNNNFGNNQHRNKPRFSGGGQQGGNNRPRKNYGQLREKYLQQARDALASGDRVLAENYFQHADHCYRMLAEEQANRPQQPRHPQQPQEAAAPNAQQEAVEQDINSIIEEEIDMNNSALPAFLKVNYEQAKPAANETPAVQDWEERDQA